MVYALGVNIVKHRTSVVVANSARGTHLSVNTQITFLITIKNSTRVNTDRDHRERH